MDTTNPQDDNTAAMEANKDDDDKITESCDRSQGWEAEWQRERKREREWGVNDCVCFKWNLTMHTNNDTLHFKTLCNANGDCRGGQKSTNCGCDIDIQLDTGRRTWDEERRTMMSLLNSDAHYTHFIWHFYWPRCPWSWYFTLSRRGGKLNVYCWPAFMRVIL